MTTIQTLRTQILLDNWNALIIYQSSKRKGNVSWETLKETDSVILNALNENFNCWYGELYYSFKHFYNENDPIEVTLHNAIIKEMKALKRYVTENKNKYTF